MFYDPTHQFFKPKDSGLKFGSLSNQELLALKPELTAKETELPHSEYYAKAKKHISIIKEKAESLEPMDPSQAFLPNSYGKHMNNTSHCAVENGYCVLPNGITYASALIRQENRTDSMVAHYNKNFSLGEDLFYKNWCPGYHYLHYSDGAFEDFGFGRVNMKFEHQLTAEELGIDFEQIQKNDPTCIAINGSSAICYNLDSETPDEPEWNTIAFYHRLTDYGRELRIRLWYGYGQTNDGVIIAPPKAEMAEHIAKCTMLHLMMEYGNDQYLETEFWKQSNI